MSAWLPELADDDLGVLLEALEAWEVKDLAGEMATSLFDSMMVRRAGDPPPDVARKMEDDKRERESAKALRKERSVLLRAKLITIRDRRRSERMTTEALTR